MKSTKELSKIELEEKHGTPQQFADAAYAAIGEISVEEAKRAIAKYNDEYRKAPAW